MEVAEAGWEWTRGFCQIEMPGRGARAPILHMWGRGESRQWEPPTAPGHELLNPTQTSTPGMTIRVHVLVSAGDAVRHAGPTHAQDLLRHEESTTETRGGAPTRDRRHRLRTATEETRGGGHTRDPARRHHREEKTAVGGSEARRRIGRVVERRGGGWMRMCRGVVWFVASQQVTRDRRHTLKECRIRAGMMSISVPTKPKIAPTCNAISIYPHQKTHPLHKNPPTPNPPSTKTINQHMKPILHDTDVRALRITDHAGAYALQTSGGTKGQGTRFCLGV